MSNQSFSSVWFDQSPVVIPQLQEMHVSDKCLVMQHLTSLGCKNRSNKFPVHKDFFFDQLRDC